MVGRLDCQRCDQKCEVCFLSRRNLSQGGDGRWQIGTWDERLGGPEVRIHVSLAGWGGTGPPMRFSGGRALGHGPCHFNIFFSLGERNRVTRGGRIRHGAPHWLRRRRDSRLERGGEGGNRSHPHTRPLRFRGERPRACHCSPILDSRRQRMGGHQVAKTFSCRGALLVGCRSPAADPLICCNLSRPRSVDLSVLVALMAVNGESRSLVVSVVLTGRGGSTFHTPE